MRSQLSLIGEVINEETRSYQTSLQSWLPPVNTIGFK